ncbi:hypothetical protein ACFL6C_12305, partial [Myxococcota bacterium]
MSSAPGTPESGDEVMYYLLKQESNKIDSYMLTGLPSDIDPPRPWFAGTRFELGSRLPLRFDLNPTWGTIMPDYLSSGIPVFSKKLLEAFRSAGVDNLDAYEVVLTDPESGQAWDDYFAVNIVGTVQCAKMDEST